MRAASIPSGYPPAAAAAGAHDPKALDQMLRTHLPLFDNVDALRWNGPVGDFAALAASLSAATSSDRPPQMPSSLSGGRGR